MISEEEYHPLTELQGHLRTQPLIKSTAHRAVSTSTTHKKSRNKMLHHNLPQGGSERTGMQGWSYLEHDTSLSFLLQPTRGNQFQKKHQFTSSGLQQRHNAYSKTTFHVQLEFTWTNQVPTPPSRTNCTRNTILNFVQEWYIQAQELQHYPLWICMHTCMRIMDR